MGSQGKPEPPQVGRSATWLPVAVLGVFACVAAAGIYFLRPEEPPIKEPSRPKRDVEAERSRAELASIIAPQKNAPEFERAEKIIGGARDLQAETPVREKRTDEAHVGIADVEKSSDRETLRPRKVSAIELEITDRYYEIETAYRESMRKDRPRDAASAVAAFLYVESWDPDRAKILHDRKTDYEKLRTAVESWDSAAVLNITRPAVKGISSLAEITLGERILLDLYNAAGLAQGASGEYWKGIRLYLSGEGGFPFAAEPFTRAAEQGAPGAALYRARIEEVLADRAAVEIRSRLKDAARLGREGRWQEVRAQLDKILLHEGHPVFREDAAEIDSLREKTDAKLAQIAKLEDRFGGRVDRLTADVVLVYDFEKSEQMKSFTSVAEGDATWGVRGGALETMTPAPGALRWNHAVRGDVAVEYDLWSLDKRNIVTSIYHREGQDRHYSFVLGLNIIRGAKDPRNDKEERRGLARNCIVKYPVRADTKDWKLQRFWDAWKSRIIGSAVAKFRFQRRRRTRVRAERAGKALRLSVDGKVIWQAEDEEYNEGYILFYSDARIRIDNLAITFPAGR